jgi:hypothetical protein
MIVSGFKRGKDAALLCFDKSVDEQREYNGFVVSRIPDGCKGKIDTRARKRPGEVAQELPLWRSRG